MCYCPYSLPRKSIIYIKTEASVPITHGMTQNTHQHQQQPHNNNNNNNNNNTHTHSNNNSPHNTARHCDTDLVQVLIECITELVLILIHQFQQCSQLSQSPLQGTCSPRAKHSAHVTDHLVQKGSVSVAAACVHKQQTLINRSMRWWRSATVASELPTHHPQHFCTTGSGQPKPWQHILYINFAEFHSRRELCCAEWHSLKVTWGLQDKNHFSKKDHRAAEAAVCILRAAWGGCHCQ